MTAGLEDLLEIGNQSRPDIFDLQIRKPELIYDRVIGIDERVAIVESNPKMTPCLDTFFKTGVSGEYIRIDRPLDEEQCRKALVQVYRDGIRSLSVVFMHSYTFPDHEQRVGAIARDIGFTHISLSSDIMPMVKIVPRG